MPQHPEQECRRYGGNACPAPRHGETANIPAAEPSVVHRLSEMAAAMRQMAGVEFTETSNGGDATGEIGVLPAILEELRQAQGVLYEQACQTPQRGLEKVLGSLTRLRSETAGHAQFFSNSAGELCTAGSFDRVLVSRIQGSMWIPHTLHLVSEVVSAALRNYLSDLEIPLSASSLEADVVRRRIPMLVSDAGSETRTYRPLIRLARSTSYVVAPVVVDGTVVALLHADTNISRRVLTSADRDIVRLFADGLGPIYERMVLTERLREQRDRLGMVFAATEAMIDDVHGGPLTLDVPTGMLPSATVAPARRDRGPAGGSSEVPAGGQPERQLTAREVDVVELLSKGVSNAEIAAQLTVSESTVKSHVKHIFRKLGATNRASAIARYGKMKRSMGRTL